MASVIAVFIILLTCFENNITMTPAENVDMEELPLSRSLAVSTYDNNDTQQDLSLDRNFVEIYQEMMKISRNVDASMDSEEEKRLKRIVGEDNLMLIKQGALTRRRSLLLRSTTEQRRAESQALRREKLNGQGLRDHMQHVKNTTPRQIDVLK